MLGKIHLIFAALLSLCFIKVSAYKVPPVKFEAVYPTGYFRLSMRDDGYSLLQFHANINKKLGVLEPGQILQSLHKPENGAPWTFHGYGLKLKLGDRLYYWIVVMKNDLTYRQEGEWTVTEFVSEDGTRVDPASVPEPDPEPASTYTYQSQPCRKSETEVLGLSSVCQGALIFSEDFSKPKLDDLNQWDAEYKFPRGPDYPFNAYVKDTIAVENGNLKIKPELTESRFGEAYIGGEWDLTSSCTGQVGTQECYLQASGANILPPVVSGKITTRNRFSFKYGRIDVRAKLPTGNWLIPEINLEPRDANYGKQRYESGLIRVAFARGNPLFSNKLYGGPILSDTEPYRSYHLKENRSNDNWNKDFHDFTMIWRPTNIEVYVDSVRYGTVNPGEGFYYTAKQYDVPYASNWLKGSHIAPFDQLFYISLGVRAGGINDFADNPDKPWTNGASKALYRFYQAQDSWYRTWTSPELLVDSVEVYAL
ncbi:LOW QUALITY PROTEIN: beta-1,3-glucan-binding protein-like [Maniola hyperantus]|uniref:LOW QUALITY PROTEIN: beta-1,3-glucan-binding protein-like n=1 Tax=Aphantopus hyperantus TaxID=2795564 RepID=UPI0015687B37|nr:LOW QUALITY PROTEIN: beta-1,3-glucan-binding protein-like [Maniola hyperantus]